MDSFKETIKYLRLPVDLYRRTWADVENYAARNSGSAYFGRTGLPEFEEDWVKYGRE